MQAQSNHEPLLPSPLKPPRRILRLYKSTVVRSDGVGP